MGSSQSVEIPGGGSEGYHVLKVRSAHLQRPPGSKSNPLFQVQDNSPGSRAGLEAFFDFVVAIGATRLDKDNDTLKELLKANIDKEIKMTVYSSKTQSIRQVPITPSNTWGGQGLLGVSIRFCSFEGANENVWHVLEVHPSSPAEMAGLRAFSDYIISADSLLHESEDLFTLIESHEGRPLKMYVYNQDDDICRDVTIKPNSKWGGEGSLGCGIGYGYLHRIPVRELPPDTRPLFKMPISVNQPATSFPQPTFQTTATSTTIEAPRTAEPTIPYVPPLLNVFPAVSSGQDEMPQASTLINAGPIMTALPTGTTDSPAAPISSGIFGVPPMPPTTIFSPPFNQTAAPQQQPQMQFGMPPPAPLWGVAAAATAAPPPASSPSAIQNGVGAAPPPSAMSYSAYSQAFTQATVPVPHSFPQMESFNVAAAGAPVAAAAPAVPMMSVQQPPMSIPTYATAPQTGPMTAFSTAPSNPMASSLFGTPINTNISLPGMPPLTVSATIPAQNLEGLQFQQRPSQ